MYDEAKRFAEATSMAYHRQYGLDVRISRTFNTYGPRMRPQGRPAAELPRPGAAGCAAHRLRRRWTALPDGAGRDAEAVWTGRELIAFGGYTAHAYDPRTRTWRGLPPLPAGITIARAHHRMVWTGSEAVFFGGRIGPDLLADGAAYRPKG